MRHIEPGQDATPFASFDELLYNLHFALARRHLRHGREDFARRLAWLLFITPVSYVLFLSPVSDYINEHDSGWLIIIGAIVVSIVWRGLMGRLILAWDKDRVNMLATQAADALGLDLSLELERQRSIFDGHFPPEQPRQAHANYSAARHLEVVEENLLAGAARQLGLEARQQHWAQKERILAALRGRAANWTLFIVLIICCVAADLSDLLWPWAGGMALVWLQLLALWPASIERMALHLAVFNEVIREEGRGLDLRFD